MKKLLSIIVVSLLLSGNAYSMTESQMMIIHQVLNVDQGKVTKQMHTDFWKDVPDKEDFIGFMETTGIMAKLTRDGMNYQMELWKSALISYQNKQVLKSAASRTNMQSVQGPIVELSEKRIILVINNIETSFSRIDKLLQSEWKD